MITFDATDYLLMNRGILFCGVPERIFESRSACREFYLGKKVKVFVKNEEYDITCADVETFEVAGPYNRSVGLLSKG